MTKRIWRKNFEIKKVDFQLSVEAMESFYKFQEPTVGKKYLTEGIWVNENGDNTGTYFIKDELRGLIKATLREILNNPDKIFAVHRKTIKYNKIYFQELKKVEKMKLKNFPERKLVALYQKFFKLLQYSHGYSLPSTWYIDSDGEDFSNHLLNYLKDRIERRRLKINFADAFSVLTTPREESFYQKEEKESLRILSLIKKDVVAKKIFLRKDVKKIEEDLTKINRALREKILRHHRKWCWTPYTYVGPAYGLDYYLEVWSSLLRQKFNEKKELTKLMNTGEKIKKESRLLFKKLEIEASYKKIFDLAAQIVWLKAYRKDVLFYGCYITDKILKELGRRHGFSLTQTKWLAHFETNKLKEFSADELNERIKFSVIYTKRDKVKILVGKRAKAFLAKQTFEKVSAKDTPYLKGTPACSGYVKGKVKIINVPEEMGKMEKGNIMVAHTTFPALVPAMKKAAAIVTDDGGITCHAAIVARELKIPCVVGTKIATKVLKDGDMVEVDAAQGVVRKIGQR